MDSAEETELRWTLSQQGVLLGRQQEELAASHRTYAEVSLQLNQLEEWLDQLQVSPFTDQASMSAPGPEGAVPRHAEPCATLCGMASRPAVNLLRHSRRSCTMCSIIRLGELRRHEPCQCFTKASSLCLLTPLSSACSPYPVAGTRRHSGITSSTAWLSTLRTRSIPWSFQRAWTSWSTSLSGSTTGLLSVPGPEEGDFPTSASQVPQSQWPLVRRGLNTSSSQRRSRCRSEETDWRRKNDAVAWPICFAQTVVRRSI